MSDQSVEQIQAGYDKIADLAPHNSIIQDLGWTLAKLVEAQERERVLVKRNKELDRLLAATSNARAEERENHKQLLLLVNPVLMTGGPDRRDLQRLRVHVVEEGKKMAAIALIGGVEGTTAPALHEVGAPEEATR